MVSKELSRSLHLSVLVFALGGWLMAILVLASMSFDGLKPVLVFLTSCTHKHLFGTPCPLCGATTATALLLSGDLEASLAANPLAAAILPFGASQLIYRALRVIRPAFSLKEELLVDGLGVFFFMCILNLAPR